MRSAALRRLLHERQELADDADDLDAIITSPRYDSMPRQQQVLALRMHASMVWQLVDLDAIIASREERSPCL